MRYLRSREGTPTLTAQTGQAIPLDRPDNILAYAVDFLDEQHDRSRFVEGIRGRLVRLRERWVSVQ
jgi:hypothetical protein